MVSIRPLALVLSMATVLAACGGGAAPASSAAAKPAASSAAPSVASASSSASSKPAISGGAASSASAAAKPSGAPASAAAPGGTIQLGLIDVMSGALAGIGTDAKNGANVAAKLINAGGGISGKQVEIVARDEEAKAPSTVNALRDLNSKGIGLTFGYGLSSDCLAALGVAKQIDSMVATSHCATTSLTGKDYDPHFARLTASDAMSAAALAAFAKQKFPTVTKWNVFGYDYVTGHDQWNTFIEDLNKDGIKATKGKEVFFPLNATDLNSYITSMLSGLPGDSAQNEGLFMATFGAGTEQLLKQGQPLKVFDKFKVVMNLNAGGFIKQSKQLGAATPDIYTEYDYYYKAYDTPLNKQFVDEYQKQFNDTPGTWAMQGFDSVYAYKAAIEKAAGSTKVPDVIKAFDAGFSFGAIPGDMAVRGADHQLETPVVIRHSKGAQGVIDFQVIPAKEILPPPVKK